MEETEKQIIEAAQGGQGADIASDEEVAEISRMILERNKAAYKELAK